MSKQQLTPPKAAAIPEDEETDEEEWETETETETDETESEITDSAASVGPPSESVTVIARRQTTIIHF